MTKRTSSPKTHSKSPVPVTMRGQAKEPEGPPATTRRAELQKCRSEARELLEHTLEEQTAKITDARRRTLQRAHVAVVEAVQSAHTLWLHVSLKPYDDHAAWAEGTLPFFARFVETVSILQIRFEPYRDIFDTTEAWTTPKEFGCFSALSRHIVAADWCRRFLGRCYCMCVAAVPESDVTRENYAQANGWTWKKEQANPGEFVKDDVLLVGWSAEAYENGERASGLEIVRRYDFEYLLQELREEFRHILDREPATTLESTPDYRTVNWRKKTFNFREQEAKVVKMLHEAGSRGLAHSSILQRLDTTQLRVRDIFKNKGKMHPAWNTLIVSKKQRDNVYRLSV
jgi:hypothetical protein